MTDRKATKYGTPYLETEAILAAQEGDDDELYRVLNAMLPGERVKFARACRSASWSAQDDAGLAFARQAS